MDLLRRTAEKLSEHRTLSILLALPTLGLSLALCGVGRSLAWRKGEQSLTSLWGGSIHKAGLQGACIIAFFIIGLMLALSFTNIFTAWLTMLVLLPTACCFVELLEAFHERRDSYSLATSCLLGEVPVGEGSFAGALIAPLSASSPFVKRLAGFLIAWLLGICLTVIAVVYVIGFVPCLLIGWLTSGLPFASQSDFHVTRWQN